MGNRVFHPKVDSKVDGSSPGPTSTDSRYVYLSFLKLEDSCKHEKTEAGGGSSMSYLVCVRIFFPKPLEIEFSPDIQQCRNFFLSSIIHHEKNFFCQVSPCKNFFPLKSVCRIYFSEITHTLPPSNIKWSPPY